MQVVSFLVKIGVEEATQAVDEMPAEHLVALGKMVKKLGVLEDEEGAWRDTAKF